MQVENILLTQLKPYEKNPRNNAAAVKGVAQSIQEFGFQQPIVIDSKNVIIAGHTRYKAAQQLGLTEVPCVRADALTPAQVKAYRILDNKLNELATWDFSALQDELQGIDIAFENFDVAFPQYNVAEVAPCPNTYGRTLAGNGNATDNFSDVVCEETEAAATTANGVGAVQEETLPEELNGVSLSPEPLPPMSGADRTTFDRIIIVFKEEDKEKLCALLGLEEISKVVYNIDELV